MTSPSWNPQQYLKFEAERARPFDDLTNRIQTPKPRDVVDLGCGPGNMTRTLLERWPEARIHGVDKSPLMMEAARRLARPGLTFELADINAWQPSGPVDVIVSNSTLHWIPTHVELLSAWLGFLRPGGTAAFQVPAAGSESAVEALASIASSPRWASTFRDVARAGGLAKDASSVRAPAEYAAVLAKLGCTVDAWETTYVHVLQGEDPVLEWYSGSGLRPYFDVLDSTGLIEFRAEVAEALRSIFPKRPYGTLFPFRRIFVVAQV